MTDPKSKNLDIYEHAALPWSRALELLNAGDSNGSWWLATTRPDGRPHVVGIGALWLDDRVYIVSGAGTRKSRNLSANPNCALSVSLPGLDLVIEGTAVRVTDQATLKRLAERYDAQGWPATVKDRAFTAPYSAPSAGPPPWNLYVVAPVAAFAVASAEPHGATRWQFD
jgi:uncharacterized pyridoxamine 5'-phosphate oxidase family protein